MNTITISGMIGADNTYFAKSPVIVTVENMQFPEASPIKVVRLDVIYDGNVVGTFPGEAVGTESISFDISSALRAIWADDNLDNVIDSAMAPITPQGGQIMPLRAARAYSLRAYREYIDSSDGEYSTDESQEYPGGSCLPGGLTEWERSIIAECDVSVLEGSNTRNGDASTKPSSSPERVGQDSITSWVDISQSGITSHFYAPSVLCETDRMSAHAPMVLRDNAVSYNDFLFLNRRGAVETCSAQMLEAMGINIESVQYTRTGRPSFTPERSIMSVATGGRRSWEMSSGFQTREWAEWWVLEFLMAKYHWMRYEGTFVPVTVTAAEKRVGIYDRTKQGMPHVDFTVSLALEG